MRRIRDEEWPDEEYTPVRGMVFGLLMSLPFWLLVYLIWRWVS